MTVLVRRLSRWWLCLVLGMVRGLILSWLIGSLWWLVSDCVPDGVFVTSVLGGPVRCAGRGVRRTVLLTSLLTFGTLYGKFVGACRA